VDGGVAIEVGCEQEVVPMFHPKKMKVFMSGGEQAVRIPKAFRFDSDEVYIRRDPETGDLTLSRIPDEGDTAGVPGDLLTETL
jgi:virulence-associated protein VagC